MEGGNHCHAGQTVHLRGSWNGKEFEKASMECISILEIDNSLVNVPARKTKGAVRRLCRQSYDRLDFFQYDGDLDFRTIANLQGTRARSAILGYDPSTNL
jgi:hypothetical protein